MKNERVSPRMPMFWRHSPNKNVCCSDFQPYAVMGGNFWEASLFKGPKVGYNREKLIYFHILFINRSIGKVSMKHFDMFSS